MPLGSSVSPSVTVWFRARESEVLEYDVLIVRKYCISYHHYQYHFTLDWTKMKSDYILVVGMDVGGIPSES